LLPAIQVTGTEYVERGTPIQLVCNVTGKPDPPLNIDWFKGHNKVKSDTQSGVIITKKIETKVLVSMLLIRKSQPEDSGEYTCKSSDRESSSIRVHVLNSKPAMNDFYQQHLNAREVLCVIFFCTNINRSSMYRLEQSLVILWS